MFYSCVPIGVLAISGVVHNCSDGCMGRNSTEWRLLLHRFWLQMMSPAQDDKTCRPALYTVYGLRPIFWSNSPQESKSSVPQMLNSLLTCLMCTVYRQWQIYYIIWLCKNDENPSHLRRRKMSQFVHACIILARNERNIFDLVSFVF